MRVRGVISIGLSGLLLATVLLGGSRPLTVSPGNPSGALIADACPTFSWGSVQGAKSYELVVYRIGKEGEEAQEVLRQSFAGSVYGWTPALDSCLERGGQYAWSLRAVSETVASEWSIPSLFQVTSAPSESELEAAVRVVRQYWMSQDETAEQGAAEAGGEVESPAKPQVSEQSPGLVPVGTAQLSVEGGAHVTGDSLTRTLVGTAQLSVEGGVHVTGDTMTKSLTVSDSSPMVRLDTAGAQAELRFEKTGSPRWTLGWNEGSGYLYLYDHVPPGGTRLVIDDTTGEISWSPKTSYVLVTPKDIRDVVGWSEAPVELPHGATITKVTAYWKQGHDLADGKALLYREDFSGNSTVLAEVHSAVAAAGVQSGYCPGSPRCMTHVLPASVDKTQYFYWATSYDPGDYEFRGLLVEYTVTGPY